MPSIHVTVPKKITYYHIAKNAGSAVSHWLREVIGIHSKNNNLTEGIPFKIVDGVFYLSDIKKKGYYTFTVVRNPWARIYSAYMDFSNADEKLKTELMTVNKWTEWPSFEQFVKTMDTFVASKDEGWKGEKSIPTTQQTEFIDDKVDLIVRYEHMNEDLRPIKDIFGVELPFVVKNDHDEEYKYFYTPETREIVAKFFKDDIEKWGYTY